jgi:transposase
MMGIQEGQKEMFSYQVDLDRRVRADHPLRAIRGAIDFSFVRQEVAHFYGHNGQVSVDPEVILKLMFLLFLDNVKSERELMRMLPERLDYLWFLGFGLDDAIPDHSVLSKARARWGQPVFESLFVRTVRQCVEAGLVDGSKIHLDGSLINAHASRDSVVQSAPELIAALKRAYQVEERKLGTNLGAPHYEPVNAALLSTTDPDAPCVRQNKKGAQGDTRPRYKQHRAVDERCGVVTAVVTTPGDEPEPAQAETLLDQHQLTTGSTVGTVVGDQQYGTIDNHRRLQLRGICTHLKATPGRPPPERFPPEAFRYEAATDRFHCPAGQWLYPRGFNPRRQHTEYAARKGLSAEGAMHHLQAQPHGDPVSPARTGDAGPRTVPQPDGTAGLRAAAPFDGGQLRASGQLPWLQACALAPALAPADPGLAHRRVPEREAAGQSPASGAKGRGRPAVCRLVQAGKLTPACILGAQLKNRRPFAIVRIGWPQLS